MRDKGMERKIRSLKVGCMMQYRGCQWEGELRSLEEHLAKDCGYVEVGCEFQAVVCGTKLLRKDVASHVETGSHNHLLLVSTLCLRQREEFEQRIEELQRQFHQREQEQKERYTENLQQQKRDFEQRLQQLEEQLSQYHQVSNKQAQDVQQSLEARLKKELEAKAHQITRMTEESDQKLRLTQEQFQQKHQELDIKVQHNKERVETAVLFGRQDRGIKGPIEVTGKEENYTFSLRENRLREALGTRRINLQFWECEFADSKPCEHGDYHDTFNPDISMPEFSKHKASDSPWYSPPFYYRSTNYKFCIVVYANGRCSGAGKYVSVYYCIMKSPSDHSQLQWPLEIRLCTIPIQIIPSSQSKTYSSDRNCNAEYQSCHFKYSFKHKWNKPKSDREGGVGWGYDQFIDHEQLKDFLFDDTLYFYVNVCTMEQCYSEARRPEYPELL